jgi:hypothetical protein
MVDGVLWLWPAGYSKRPRAAIDVHIKLLSGLACEALIDKTATNIGWLNEHSSP